MKMDVVKYKTVDYVLRELHTCALVHNLVRQVMIEATSRQEVPVSRISLIVAVGWLQSPDIGSELTPLVVNYSRIGRVEPRV